MKHSRSTENTVTINVTDVLNSLRSTLIDEGKIEPQDELITHAVAGNIIKAVFGRVEVLSDDVAKVDTPEKPKSKGLRG